MIHVRRLYRPLGALLLLTMLLLLCSYMRVMHYAFPALGKADAMPEDEAFLSYAAHGDFLGQYKALRAGTRLAFETNRTLIVPALRLGALRNGSEIDRGDAWIEVPWSKILDFEAAHREFGIRIRDLIAEPDPTTVQWVHISPPQETAILPATSRLALWLQRPLASYATPTHTTAGANYTATQHVHHLDDFRGLRGRYVHCGAITGATFKQALRASKPQLELHAAMTKHLLLWPDGLAFVNQTAHSVVDRLGGSRQFSTLFLNLAKYLGLDSTPAAAPTADPPPMDNSTTTRRHRRRRPTPQEQQIIKAFRRHYRKTKTHAMQDIVFDIFSTMAIDQSVAAAMPVQPGSALHAHLPVSAANRSALLDACLDYRHTVDPRYPVIYLVSDLDLFSAAEVYRPLLDAFPCMFSKVDMDSWAGLPRTWWHDMDHVVSERGGGLVDYETQLSPSLDLLIGGHGYSHVEIPFSARAYTVITLQQSTSGAATIES